MKRTLTDITSLKFQVKVSGEYVTLFYQRGGRNLSRTIRRDTAVEARIITK